MTKVPWIESHRISSLEGSNAAPSHLAALSLVAPIAFLQPNRHNDSELQLLVTNSFTQLPCNANKKHLLNFTVLQQLDRPNRYVLLEVWDTEANYNNWGFNPVTGNTGSPVTTNFVTRITPLLGSPLDYRLNSLCGETYVDGTGCTSP